MSEDTITILYGMKEIKLKAPVIRREIIKRKWWFNKEEYYVDWEYCTVGPFKTYKDAYESCPH